MKKALVLLSMLLIVSYGQEVKQVPQISVNGR
jgi:hypothetical protein